MNVPFLTLLCLMNRDCHDPRDMYVEIYVKTLTYDLIVIIVLLQLIS